MTSHCTSGTSSNIEQLLRRRSAWFDDAGLSLEQARDRAAISRAIAERFGAFQSLRDQVLGRRMPATARAPEKVALIEVLIEAGLIEPKGSSLIAADADARRYLSGGWLEEYAGLAALAAGADEVRIGQRIGWIAKGFEGVNEIDVIARFGARLLFVSTKALRSRLDEHDGALRERLMDALHECDNLVDHFGDDGAAALLLVTTDLYDERERAPRYEQLHGKAAALRVALASLEHMQWEHLVARIKSLVNGGSRD